MRRQIVFLPCLAALAISSISIAEPIATPKQISPTAAENGDDLCGGKSHIEDVQCLATFLKKQDRELNQVYKRALAALPEKDNSDDRKARTQLVKSQRAWLKYRDENCTLIGGQEGGSNLWVTHFAALCEKNETAERIKFLKSIADGNKP
jgi:uncharacterized protein YecT (DUF1311 family)